MLRDDGAAMSAYERKADVNHTVSEIQFADVCF